MRPVLTIGIALLALSASGCMSTVRGWFGGSDGDPTEQYLQTMATAPMVMYFVNFHKEPAVGQWAIYEGFNGDTWYGLVGGGPGAWLVERRETVPGRDFKIATLMEVSDQGTVLKAWAAPYDSSAVEKPVGRRVQVMDAPTTPRNEGGPTEGPRPVWTQDTVAGLPAQKRTITVQGKRSETWFSTVAYFGWMLHGNSSDSHGGIVKSAYVGKVNIELQKQGVGDLIMSMQLPEER